MVEGGLTDTTPAAVTAGLQELLASLQYASDGELLAALSAAEVVSRLADRLAVAAIAAAGRCGLFASRGYRTPAAPASTAVVAALGDVVGWDRVEARRRVLAAEHVEARIGLDGTVCPARLAATAGVFATGACSLRHVEVIARVLGSKAAERLSPGVWAGAEAELADKASCYTPTELSRYGTALVEALDQDGPEPQDTEPEPVNELNLTRHGDRRGGSLRGRFEDPVAFEAITSVLEAHAAPADADDRRSLPQRQADALAEVCTQALTHGDVPEHGGRRPQLTVLIPLTELEGRARRGALLDTGETLTPAALRALACDAGVIPAVLDGQGQPLDIGRASRTIPDGLRRAVTLRDRGCAHPGCERPSGWCEIHHVQPWQNGGATAVQNSLMLCRYHHRLLHRNSSWKVRIHDGSPSSFPQPGSTPNDDPAPNPHPSSNGSSGVSR